MTYQEKLEKALTAKLVEANQEALRTWEDETTATIAMKNGDILTITFPKLLGNCLDLLPQRNFYLTVNQNPLGCLRGLSQLAAKIAHLYGGKNHD